MDKIRNILHMPEGSLAEYLTGIIGLIGAIFIPAIIMLACVAGGIK